MEELRKPGHQRGQAKVPDRETLPCRARVMPRSGASSFQLSQSGPAL